MELRATTIVAHLPRHADEPHVALPIWMSGRDGAQGQMEGTARGSGAIRPRAGGARHSWRTAGSGPASARHGRSTSSEQRRRLRGSEKGICARPRPVPRIALQRSLMDQASRSLTQTAGEALGYAGPLNEPCYRGFFLTLRKNTHWSLPGPNRVKQARTSQGGTGAGPGRWTAALPPRSDCLHIFPAHPGRTGAPDRTRRPLAQYHQAE